MANQEIKKRRKPEAKRKELFVRARVTEEQKELIDEAAKHTGVTTSAWMVATLLRTARKELAEKT